MKVKAGDVLTVQTSVDSYSRTRSFDDAKVDVREDESKFGGLKAISKLQIHKVVQNDIHDDLAKYGLKIHH